MAPNVRCHQLNGAPDCCGSCHEDDETGFFELSDVELPDGRTALVCCVVAAWINEDPHRAAAAAPK